MIFLVKKKTFREKAEKWLPEKNYFIIDGEDSGTISAIKDGKGSGGKSIADKYSYCITNGSFTPSKKLIRLLSGDNKDYEYSQRKIDEMVEDFILDKTMTAAIVSSIKAMFACDTDDEINIFIVLPNKVYKFLAKNIRERIMKLFPTDFAFAYLENELINDKKLITKELSSKKIKKIWDLVEKNEKKYKLFKK